MFVVGKYLVAWCAELCFIKGMYGTVKDMYVALLFIDCGLNKGMYGTAKDMYVALLFTDCGLKLAFCWWNLFPYGW